MDILTTGGWIDYQLIDSGDGKRLERFGRYILVRPDPQVLWRPGLARESWLKADAIFENNSGNNTKSTDKGKWILKNKLPKEWVIEYKNLKFKVHLSPFKHTGVFPEQAVHWDWMSDKIRQRSSQGQPQIKVLNLFGYTGGASMACADAGAMVTHIDASYPTIGWGRENQRISGLEQRPIRWILDDAIKFCERELKRGSKYDGIIMDPPIYGHGPNGEKWDFNRSFPKLFELCKQILTDTPLFVIVNAYAITASSLMLQNVLEDYFDELKGSVESGELALKDSSGRLLSTGIFARWSI